MQVNETCISLACAAFTLLGCGVSPLTLASRQQHSLYRHHLALHEGELRASICWVERRFRVDGEQLIDAEETVYSRVNESHGGRFCVP